MDTASFAAQLCLPNQKGSNLSEAKKISNVLGQLIRPYIFGIRRTNLLSCIGILQATLPVFLVFCLQENIAGFQQTFTTAEDHHVSSLSLEGQVFTILNTRLR